MSIDCFHIENLLKKIKEFIEFNIESANIHTIVLSVHTLNQKNLSTFQRVQLLSPLNKIVAEIFFPIDDAIDEAIELMDKNENEFSLFDLVFNQTELIALSNDVERLMVFESLIEGNRIANGTHYVQYHLPKKSDRTLH